MADMTTTKRKREQPPPAPPRPTVEDVDAWLRQIDDVLESLPMEGPRL